MIIKSNIITDLRIDSVKDLFKLKPFVEEGILKVNKSQIGRELGVDKRTIFVHIYLILYTNIEAFLAPLFLLRIFKFNVQHGGKGFDHSVNGIFSVRIS